MLDGQKVTTTEALTKCNETTKLNDIKVRGIVDLF